MCIGVSTPPWKKPPPLSCQAPPSYIGKISQFEFLVMTEKNIFVYKFFLPLNISDFNLSFIWKLEPLPLKKVTPSLSQQAPLKVKVLLSPSPFWKFGWRLNFPPPSSAERGGGAHIVSTIWHMHIILRDGDTESFKKVLE